MPDNDMGKGRLRDKGFSLVEQDIEDAAKEWGMSVEDAKKNMVELLQKTLSNKQ